MDEEVKVQGFRQNVVIGLLVLVLFSLDVTKLENSAIGAALNFLLTPDVTKTNGHGKYNKGMVDVAG